jgi:hypothetical protein
MSATPDLNERMTYFRSGVLSFSVPARAGNYSLVAGKGEII